MNRDDEEDGPPYPHLAIVTAKGMIPLRKDNVIAIIEDKTKPDGIFLLAVESVSHRQLVFRAYSADKSSTRKVTFKGDWKGDYKSWMRKAAAPKSAAEVDKLVDENYNPADYL